MKRFVSDAVRAATDAQGKKLTAELNKQWATALKAQKQYDKLVAIIEKGVNDLRKRLDEVGAEAIDEIQALINYSNKELKPIAAAVTAFEKAEDALAKKYKLKKVDPPPAK
jgi:Na+/phosphate symporter